MVIKTIGKVGSGANFINTNLNNSEIDVEIALSQCVQGDTLKFLPGIYTFSKPVKRITGINIDSDPLNRATLKIKEWVETVSPTKGCGAIWYWGKTILEVTNAKISNLKFDGSLGHTYAWPGYGCLNLLIIDGNVIVDNCYFFDGINDAINIEGNFNVVKNCMFIDIIHDNITVGKGNNTWSGKGSNDNLIENCFADNPNALAPRKWIKPDGTKYGDDIGWHNAFIRIYNTSRTTIRNCTSISLNAQVAFDLSPEQDIWKITDIVFEKNMVANNSTEGGFCFYDLSPNPYSSNRTNIKIIDNAFINNRGQGAIVFKTGTTQRAWNNIEIARNTFATSNTAEITRPAGTTVGIVNIHDNITSDIIPAGIGSTIQNNTTLPGVETLIQNGTFDTTISPWSFDLAGGVGSAIAQNGEAVITLTQLGSGQYGWNNKFFQSGLYLLPNKNYALKFDVRSNNSQKIEAYLNDAGSQTSLILAQDVFTSQTKTPISLNFVTQSIVPSNVMVRFKIPVPGIYYLDNIQIVDTTTCTPVWTCKLPLDGTEINQCDSTTRLNSACNPPVVPKLTSIEISGAVSIIEGQTGQYSASCKDQNGNILTCPAISWGSSNNAIATISANGLVTGVSAGVVTIAAVNGAISGFKDVIVASSKGMVNISSSPAGAKIFIDNVDSGQITPFTIQNVAAGFRTIKLTKSGYDDVIDSVEVLAGKTTIKSYTLNISIISGTLNVSTIPTGAYIFIDGAATKTQTPQIIPLAPGRHTIRLVMNGYNDVNEGFTIFEGQTIIKVYTLNKSGSSIASLLIPAGLALGVLGLIKK